MSDVQVRIPYGIGRHLLEVIRQPGPREPVAFGLARHARIGSRTLILVKELAVPGESAFLPSRGHGARWRGSYTIELLNRAVGRQCGLVIFHAHGESRQVDMSPDDRDSAGQLLPKFQLVVPERAHGSIVVGPDSAAGMILLPGADRPTQQFSFRILDDGMSTWPLPRSSEMERRIFERQPLTDNPLLRRVLGRSTVAVVGLSGGGSQVADHLAAIGIGEIIGIDNQRADVTNLVATPNLGWLDALFKVRKTTASKWRTWAINRHVTFTPVNARVPEPAALDALKRADIIVGCANNLHARADLNEIAWRYCIPLIDVGLILTTDDRDFVDPKPLNAISGNITTALPGGPCLWCTGFISQTKLDDETGGRGRPYLQGEHRHSAYVTTFNGTLAAEAASEVLRLLVGLRGGSELKRFYEGFSGTLVECAVKKNANCKVCRNMLGAGDPVWRAIQVKSDMRREKTVSA